MGGGKKAAAPDPNKVANAQFNLNRRTSQFEARQNRFNQNNPFGSINWVNQGTANKPKWVQTTTLSAPQQNILNNQQGIQQGAGSMALGMMPGVQNRLNQPAYNLSLIHI